MDSRFILASGLVLLNRTCICVDDAVATRTRFGCFIPILYIASCMLLFPSELTILPVCYLYVLVHARQASKNKWKTWKSWTMMMLGQLSGSTTKSEMDKWILFVTHPNFRPEDVQGWEYVYFCLFTYSRNRMLVLT